MSKFYVFIPIQSRQESHNNVLIEHDFKHLWANYNKKIVTDSETIVFSGFHFHPKNHSSKDQYLAQILKTKSKETPLHIRGSYAGVYWSRTDAQWLLFTDPLSTKPLYYAKTKGGWHISNDYDSLAKQLSKHQSLEINPLGVYQILCFGYALEENTLFSPIKRLPVGTVGILKTFKTSQAVASDYDLDIKTLYQLPLETYDINRDEAAEEVDRLFKQAINRSFSLDKNLGRNHLVSLSGGLDSRMTSWVAHCLGFRNQTNLTFAQKNSLDKKIAERISRHLNHDWHFLALDGGDILRDMDLVTQHTGGNVVYYGQAHTRRSLQDIDGTKYGLLHTGMLGDVVLGSYLQNQANPAQFSVASGASSTRFISKLKALGFSPSYPNEEHHKMMLRGLYGMNMGLLSVYDKTESYSPFTDIDFFDFCMRLPVKMRANHSLYIHWMKTYYPASTSFIWERTRANVLSRNITFRSKSMPIKTWVWKLFERIRFKNTTANPNFMTPIDYWLTTEYRLKKDLNDYAKEHFSLITNEENIRQDLEDLYRSGNGVEKIQVLTVLAAAKRYLN